MHAMIPILLVSTAATAFATRSVAQERGQPGVRSRRPVDVSVEGFGEAIRRAPGDSMRGGSVGLSARSLDCPESIADQAASGCLQASSTPTLGMLYPYPGLNNVFVPQAFVGGGENNQAPGARSTVSGGRNNTALGPSAVVGGGGGNIASGYNSFGRLDGYATVGGGGNNRATGEDATVAGGRVNIASAAASTVGGGKWNTASGYAATVGGGRENTAYGAHATVGGGKENTADGRYATIGGGADNQASGGTATVSGGARNRASGLTAAVSGGRDNTANGDDATVGGGWNNTAYGNLATVGGGGGFFWGNTASAQRTTIAGGSSNTASGDTATVGGGFSNLASGDFATIGGGRFGTASGQDATVPGGFSNRALSDFSFAAGRQARAIHAGAFVWGDSQAVFKQSSQADEFSVYCSGGARLFSNSTATTGVLLAPGGSTWTMVSDRDAKENVEPVDVRSVLDKVANLPVATWNYKAQDDSIRHMGPMAQDFHAAFGLGLGEKTIDTIDPNGVALAAIQGLRAELDELRVAKDAEIAALRAERDSEIEGLRARLERLEAMAQARPAK